ncbi:hypothetical protein O181_004423 [Austropuccinia psidii MF-1]|uniref:Uncharacterized protein n=1 Tax=Austropuccinia psidii MF-1 TaxID=1389203 RepID=A0A9Q3GEI7_9BASI|nr:hypothetical protein [Austropuccinia psidii MF-1]
MRKKDFKQGIRTSKEGFEFIYHNTRNHEVFQNHSTCEQLPNSHQLELMLEFLGSNGNAASVGKFSCNFQDCGLWVFLGYGTLHPSFSYSGNLNLFNQFHLNRSTTPTIYPSSLLHHPHLADLLTIHPSKLTLKYLQQSTKHLHQYLDSNISPQSSFTTPLESNNHFITHSKRGNSSNSVPSKSQKLFQTDFQTTQSPFQNHNQSIVSTSPSRTPSILKHYLRLIITILQ